MTNQIAVTRCTTCKVELTPETASPYELKARSGYCRHCRKMNLIRAAQVKRRRASLNSSGSPCHNQTGQAAS